jgi:two-component system response regulator HydG
VLLAIDDEMRRDLTERLEGRGHEVSPQSEATEALQAVESDPADVIIVALGPDDAAQLAFIGRVRELTPTTSIVALTDAGSVDVIVQAIQRGADQCLTQPIRDQALDVVIERALDRPPVPRGGSQGPDPGDSLDNADFDKIIGSHPLMQRLLKKTLQAARSRATVLIHGETGTGKELIAAAIHHNSKRRGGPFVRLNCSALSPSLLESELFGHERGAFTGATTLRRGRFEKAHLGTLFLDEVSEIPPDIQVKLLRFLQEREFERVGGDETIVVDVRVVAATNRDLKTMVDDRTFREDLYYRLNVVRLEVPPLRARPSDIALLSEHFLHRYAAENDKSIDGITPKALDTLMAHPWPGNVRELQNVMEQAVVLCEGNVVALEDLPLAPQPPQDEPLRLMIPGVTLAELERFAIQKTLEAVGGSPTKAAAILGISRRTIQYRMREWGLGRGGDDTNDGDAPPPSEDDG